jgi:thiopeptide-type bacteriocin biosynthesis protein
MTGRPTPFGLFAGCSVGSIGPETRLRIAGRGAARRHTRLDMDYLFALVDALGRDRTMRQAFVYRPNSSLYETAGRLRYVEARVSGTKRSYHLVSVESTDALVDTLARARTGATIEALGAALVDDDVTAAEAHDYVLTLIDSQLLAPDASVPVTTADAASGPIDLMIHGLEAHAATRPAAHVLIGVREALAEIDRAGLGAAPEQYKAIARTLESLPPKVDESRLFQVDLSKPPDESMLGQAVVEEILKGVAILHRLTRLEPSSALRRFREAFLARYEQREVPLVEALDDESGFGFGSAAETSPLLEDLPFPLAPDETTIWGRRQTTLLRLLAEATSAGRREIVLDARDLEQLAETSPPSLPDALAVIASVAAPSERALASGDFRIRVRGAQGPSGARLLGRFCHADAALERGVRAHLEAEESLAPDAIFTEVVHLPDGRVGNVLFRPVLRRYEIPYLGVSGAPPERQIPITDLLASVVGEDIVLRSASLGRRVIPRLTTAHNYAWQSVPVYRFLCALQEQRTARGLGWDWGVLADAPFLPRVSTGRLVLAAARWRLDRAEHRRLASGSASERYSAVQRWRTARGLPRWIVLADGDNALPVDLDNVLSVDWFVHEIKGRDDTVVEELFPSPEELCATSPEGGFVHEIVIPFVRQPGSRRDIAAAVSAAAAPVDAQLQRASPAPAVRRAFPPGSEWLYAKLYSGTAAADQALCEVAPMIREAMATGDADAWFFIRYRDPEPHLRLRLHGAPGALQHRVWPALCAALAPLVDGGCVPRIVLDTYEREVERYGGPEGVILAERVFHADSDAALEIVEQLDAGDAGLDERWRLALLGIDLLLSDLDLDVEMRRALTSGLRGDLAVQLRCDRPLTRALGDRFRRERTSLVQLLDGGGPSSIEPGIEILRQRSTALRPILADLRAHDAAGRLSASCLRIIASCAHMHVNRILRGDSREQEFVLYDFLVRLYDSRRHQRQAAT